MRNSERLCVAVILAGGFILTSTLTAQNQGRPNSAKMKALMEARRDTLKTRLEAFESKYKSGLTKADFVFASRKDFFKAELTLAPTKDERIAVLKKLVANAMENESLFTQRVNAGSPDYSQTDLLFATAERLEADIELLKAQDAEG